jgi:hypothetical protein
VWRKWYTHLGWERRRLVSIDVSTKLTIASLHRLRDIQLAITGNWTYPVFFGLARLAHYWLRIKSCRLSNRSKIWNISVWDLGLSCWETVLHRYLIRSEGIIAGIGLGESVRGWWLTWSKGRYLLFLNILGQITETRFVLLLSPLRCVTLIRVVLKTWCDEIALIISSYSNTWSIHAEINLGTWLLCLARHAKSAPLFIWNWSAKATPDWCKRLGYNWLLGKLNWSWWFNDVSEHPWDSWFLSGDHITSQLVAFTVCILNYKVTRDFLSKSWPIALVLMLEHYKVMSWFVRSLKLDIDLVSLASSNTLDDLTSHRNFVATFNSWKWRAL